MSDMVTIEVPQEVAGAALRAWRLFLAEQHRRNREALKACQDEAQRVASGHRHEQTLLVEERAQLLEFERAYYAGLGVGPVSGTFGRVRLTNPAASA